MKQHYFSNSRFRFLFFFFLLCSPLLQAQLSNFTLTVVETDETCAGNGTLTITTTGTTAGATMVYTIYHLPNATDPIATQGGSTLGGLVAGNYLIVATQTLGAQSGSQQTTVTIDSTIQALTYQVTGYSPPCSPGSLTVNVFTGFPLSYEIISGPVTMPPQASNVLEGTPPGVYQVRVFDICGEGVVQNFTLTGTAAALVIGPTTFPEAVLPDCDHIKIKNMLSAPLFFGMAYPLQVTLTLHPPTGPDVVTNITLSGPTPEDFTTIIPFYPGELYSYDLVITDDCGNTYTRNGNEVEPDLTVSVSSSPMECGKALTVSPFNYLSPFTINFVSAPAGFNPTVFNATHPGPFSDNVSYYNPTIPVPEGLYVVEITDACGRTATGEYQFVNTVNINPIIVSMYRGCDGSTGSISLTSPNGPLETVIITSAPTAYTGNLPQDVSFNIATNDKFYMNSFPIGTYIFHTIDACGNELDTTVNIQGSLVISNEVVIIPHCNAFDLEMHHLSNLTQSEGFWLQKLNTVSGLWGHPLTGFANNLPPNTGNAVAIGNNTTTLNLIYTGTFRIIKSYPIYGNGTPTLGNCAQQTFEFEFTGTPKIDAIYSFSCSGNTSDVIVSATGAGPLVYRITLKDGNPFVVQNGTSNIFLGLAPGTYNFQVQDACNNILNRLFDITEPIDLEITANSLCGGQSGSLSVPALSFLDFQWWKGDDTGNILSTTNSLNFPSFNATTDSGVYHVRLTYPNNNSCIDIVLDFTIDSNLGSPNVGVGSTQNLCEHDDVIDLFSFLTGTPDAGGTWTETSASGGTLTGSNWSTLTVDPGTYSFTYSLTGVCSTAQSVVTIMLNELPQTPVPAVAAAQCEGNDVQLSVTPNQTGVTYNWTGPNGFTSSEQNPLLSNATTAVNGTYTVTASIGSCVTVPVNIEIAVAPQPQFVAEAGCDGNNYMITVTASNNSFDEDLANYTWTGPNNYSATGNPVDITGGDAGMYTVLVESGGCSATSQVAIVGTVCAIPKGVSANNDGDNDTFDLAGFGVENLKIYNRYGMVVYEKANYLDEWDGHDYNGNELPSATYYYYVRLGSGIEKTGWVYLLRRG